MEGLNNLPAPYGAQTETLNEWNERRGDECRKELDQGALCRVSPPCSDLPVLIAFKRRNESQPAGRARAAYRAAGSRHGYGRARLCKHVNSERSVKSAAPAAGCENPGAATRTPFVSEDSDVDQPSINHQIASESFFYSTAPINSQSLRCPPLAPFQRPVGRFTAALVGRLDLGNFCEPWYRWANHISSSNLFNALRPALARVDI